MKNHIIIILLACCLMSLPGCESYLDVNKGVTTQNNVEAVEYLPGILAAYEGMYYDIRALGPLTQMLGTNATSNFANNYYYRESDSGSEIWRMVYLSQGMNLENMIGQAEKEGKWTLAGIGYAIKAFSWDALTKYHGEAPMKQAFEPGRTVFEYDYQPEIMAQCRKWAETAITCLEKEDATDYGDRLSSADLVYHGNKEKWLKFAHSVIVSDLAALTNKKDFATEYAPELLRHAEFAIDSNDANFAVECAGFNNVWGTASRFLNNSYWETEYITLLLTGSLVQYNEADGNRVPTTNEEDYEVFFWQLAVPQIICDTSKTTGHYDPRAIAKLCTRQGKYYDIMSDADAIKSCRYYGSSFTSSDGPAGYNASNLYGINTSSMNLATDGAGRWLFRDDAPYILLTASEIQFELAETYWKLGRKSDALSAFRKGVELDLEFSGKYLNPGCPREDERGYLVAGGGLPGGSQITHETYDALASEYLNGPYVKGLSENKLTLSHPRATAPHTSAS